MAQDNKQKKTAKTAKSTGAKKTAASKPKSTQKTTKGGSKTGDVKYVGNDRRRGTADWSGNRQYIYSIAFIATAILFGCIAFISGENLWAGLRGVFFSLFGVGFFMFTIYIFAAAVTVTVKRIKKTPMWLILAGFTLTLIFVGMIHVLTVDTSLSFTEQLKYSASLGWSAGAEDMRLSGGILGALLGGGLLAAFGKGPAVAISIILVFVNILLIGVTALNLFGMSLRDTVTASELRRRERSEIRKADREQERLELEKQREQIRKDLEQRQRQQAKELQRKKKERPVFTYDELGDEEIDKLLDEEYSSYRRAQQEPEEKPEEKQKPKKERSSIRSIFTARGTEQEEASSTQAEGEPQPEGQPEAQPEAEPVSKPGVRFEPPTESQQNTETSSAESDELTAALVHNAVTEANKRSEQTQAAVESFVDEKARSRRAYEKPPIDCLAAPRFNRNDDCASEMKTTSKKLVDTLKSFNVETELVGVCRGPSVTRYELQPAPGVKISKITNLADDIALNLAASGVRIEAPIPNKSAVGIEVPNKTRATVTLREIIISQEFRSASSKINVALGKDITGNVNCADLAKMPHLLIAGTTGSGKSVCLNCMIASILYNATPDEVKMILIDPKQVEFSVYDGIPHLLVPVISNPRKAAGALAWAVGEMENRYKAFSECGVRDIKGFNRYCQSHPELSPMPLIVIFIDELNDLMMVSPKEVEDSVCRLAQKARAAGMHLVVATQRPSVDVITGIIKANIPSRISLSVSSQVDSRTILDSVGAEKLLGNGDMLFNPVGMSKPVRIQGAYLSDEEVEDIVDYIKNQETGDYDQEIMEEIERNATVENKKKGAGAAASEDDEPEDEMFMAAVDAVVTAQIASTTFLQKKLKLGYARASRIMDELHEKGYVSAQDGSKPRKVLISQQQWMEIKMGLEEQ